MKDKGEVRTNADQHGEEPSAGVQGEGFLTDLWTWDSSRPLSGRELFSSDPRRAYDRFAPIYDEWNAQNDYEMWLGETLLPELEKHGLRSGWALDVGCGTGRAFVPLLDRGWRVVGCDLSSGMLAEAERKFGAQVRLLELDARSLPPLSPAPELPAGAAFHLILLLNDVLNYMTEDGELEQVFAGVKRNLSRAQGLVAFDLNTLKLFREDFATGVLEGGAGDREWRGLTTEAKPGGVFEARLSGPGVETHVHRQRHWPPDQVRAALEASGLRCPAALGQREADGRVLLSAEPDEERDDKVIYIAGQVA
jgi:SAM-dependent methyltransferase